MLAEGARILYKRRVWLLVALLLAVAAGVGAYKSIHPKQESKAQVLLVPSLTQPGVNGLTNPFMGLGGSIAVVASVVQVAVMDSTTAQHLVAQGDRASYQVAPNLGENAGPVLLVTVDDKSAEMSKRTLAGVLNAIGDTLHQLQVKRNVPSSLFISAVVLTASQHPQPVHKAQVQTAVLAMVVVLIVLITLILVAERRRRRRTRSPEANAAVDEDWGESQYTSQHVEASAVRPTQRRRRREARAARPTAADPTAQPAGRDSERESPTTQIFVSSGRPH